MLQLWWDGILKRDRSKSSDFKANSLLFWADGVLKGHGRRNEHAPLIRPLATLRDPAFAGLPKLLSGELSVAGGNPPELPDSSNRRRSKP